MTPREASMATRPCLISASRHFLMSPGAAPSDKPSGSKICGKQWGIDHERASPRFGQNIKILRYCWCSRATTAAVVSSTSKCAAQTRDAKAPSYVAPSLPALAITCHSPDKRTGGKLVYPCLCLVLKQSKCNTRPSLICPNYTQCDSSARVTR